MTPWRRFFSSARQFSDPQQRLQPADAPDFLTLHAARGVDSLLESVAELLVGVGVGERFTVTFREPDSVALRVFHSTIAEIAASGDLQLPTDGLAPAGTLPLPEHVAPMVLRDGTGRRLAIHALLPLTAHGNHYGYLVLHDGPVAAVDQAVELARHLGLALYNHQVAEERARHQSLDALKVSMMLQTSVVLRELDLDRALARLMELTVTTVKGEVGCIALTDQAGALELKTEWGIDQRTLDQLRLTDGRSLAEVAALEGMLCLFRDRQEMAELAPCEVIDRIHSLIALPVHSASGVRGCVVIANAPALRGNDVELLKMITDVCSTAIDNALRHMDSMERESLRAQLRLAGDIQQGLLPLYAPEVDGAVLAGCNLPADESSGDYYDFFRIDEHLAGFVIADATGHGIGAALIATTARSALRALLHQRGAEELNLADVLTQLNELAESDFNDDKFITLFIGVYDARCGRLQYASAGHNPPMLLLRQRSRCIERLDATGLPLGMFAGMPYETVELTGLERGDLMLVMTDGVNEASDAAGEQFGLDRVESLMMDGTADESPRAVIDRIIDELTRFTGPRPREDDITMVCLRCEAPTAADRQGQPPPDQSAVT